MSFASLVPFVIFLTILGHSFANPVRRRGSEGYCDYLEHAIEAARRMQDGYVQSTGLYTPRQWWTSANSIHALADLMFFAPELRPEYEQVLRNTFIQAPFENLPMQNKSTSGLSRNRIVASIDGFNNEYYDDSAWWALTWIKAYDLTYNPEYLKQAKNIFEYLRDAWDDTCGGGIWWRTDKTYKNAITNELFFTIAASLANRDSANKQYYLKWAKNGWNWFRRSGMANSNNLINDGLNEECVNNMQPEWTYNQGVVLGGLIELSRLENGDYIQQAMAYARASVPDFTQNNVLTEPCEENSDCEGAEEFKGIYIRYLADLQVETGDEKLQSFIMTQADILYANNNYNGNYGIFWNGPKNGTLNTASQYSALSAFTQAVRVGGCKWGKNPTASGTRVSSTFSSSSVPASSDASASSKNRASRTTNTSGLVLNANIPSRPVATGPLASVVTVSPAVHVITQKAVHQPVQAQAQGQAPHATVTVTVWT